jgi:hypothetical protein
MKKSEDNYFECKILLAKMLVSSCNDRRAKSKKDGPAAGLLIGTNSCKNCNSWKAFQAENKVDKEELMKEIEASLAKPITPKAIHIYREYK